MLFNGENGNPSMSKDLLGLAQESIDIEYNASKLYTIFRDTFPEDADFWWQLVIEENNHAGLIRCGIDQFMSEGLFPEEILTDAIPDLVEANKKITSLIEDYQKDPPSRKTAFNVALKMEMSAGVIHFQQAMEQPALSKVMEIFQELNQNDKNHIARIKAYMKEKGIGITP